VPSSVWLIPGSGRTAAGRTSPRDRQPTDGEFLDPVRPGQAPGLPDISRPDVARGGLQQTGLAAKQEDIIARIRLAVHICGPVGEEQQRDGGEEGVEKYHDRNPEGMGSLSPLLRTVRLR